MVTLAFILSELTPLWYLFGRFVSALSLEYPSGYFHDTSQVCRTGPDSVFVLYTRMTTHAVLLF